MRTHSGARRRVKPKSAREVALQVLYHVDTRKAFADLLLNQAFKEGKLEQRDIALATEIVNGTLRWRARLDWILAGYVKAGLDTLQPYILNTLRLGLYQMIFLDRIPTHAAVDESVKLARKYGHSGTAGLVNAVLRGILRDDATGANPEDKIEELPEALSIAYSHPIWLVERWLEAYGEEETRLLLEANNRTPEMGLRVNQARTDRETLRRALAEGGIECESSPFTRLGLRVKGGLVLRDEPHFRDGQYFVQDESETIAVELLDPQPGEFILDLCAAPGGKTCHIQEARASAGHVLAVDIQRNRLSRVRENVQRMQLKNVWVVCADGRSLDLSRRADRVLVDAPCSGLGVLARRSDARWRKNVESLRSLAMLQRELLFSGGEKTASGGVLVYSVCSNEPEEGILQVKRFLAGHPNFELEDASTILSPEVVKDGCVVVTPHRHHTDGAFAARIRRRK